MTVYTKTAKKIQPATVLLCCIHKKKNAYFDLFYEGEEREVHRNAVPSTPRAFF